MKKNWPKWLVILAFVISTILAGNNAVAVRYSNAEIPPFLGGALRFGSASIFLFIILFAMRLDMPKGGLYLWHS